MTSLVQEGAQQQGARSLAIDRHHRARRFATRATFGGKHADTLLIEHLLR